MYVSSPADCQCPFVERSLAPCRKTTGTSHLAKKMEKEGFGGMTIQGGRGDEGWGWGDHKVENKCDFSCCWKEAMSFAPWSLSGSLFQRMSAALWNDLALEHFLFVFLPNLETFSLHRKEEQRQKGGLYWETMQFLTWSFPTVADKVLLFWLLCHEYQMLSRPQTYQLVLFKCLQFQNSGNEHMK